MAEFVSFLSATRLWSTVSHHETGDQGEFVWMKMGVEDGGSLGGETLLRNTLSRLFLKWAVRVSEHGASVRLFRSLVGEVSVRPREALGRIVGSLVLWNTT